ncbi:MAG: prolipoprotein diacylglyceryl transferase [Bacteroidota bacterium]|nr:prolipoprotein diacylglyceryl transferase [Bacteroidota bacterium]MDX5448231.1 prolipoprotein diacylglyceryl transferase [Bacteroidota bacterium]MDX5505388.1 prolipoprotein diacylglyceryl transferase [Bacteroidota bacterium]
MSELLTITWDMSRGLDLGFFTLRYYSLLFALGFLLGFQVMKKIFKTENRSEKELDSLLTYMIIATVVGARLGHVFFYDWGYYKQHPVEILKVWEGGLASHGAAIAIIIGLYIYSRKVSKTSVLWILDRVVITVALAGTFIRVGNFMNSEIYGKVGNSGIETVFALPFEETVMNQYSNVHSVEVTPTGNVMQTDSLDYPEYRVQLHLTEKTDPLRFSQNFRLLGRKFLNSISEDRMNMYIPEDYDLETIEDSPTTTTIEFTAWGLPRYPTQLIEALGYFLIFIVLFFLFWKTRSKEREGLLFGLFLVLIFGFRFVIEFWKANQSAFEESMQFNMGQWLSVPLVIAGLYFIIAAKNKNLHES